jgi:hypothetical protein
MKKLTVADLGTLDQYQLQRPALRQAVIEHKKNRRVPLGPHASLYFEDRMTMKYQVLEMMRAEKLRDTASIEEELAAYNPLIPDGHNLKATFMIEVSDPEQRRLQLRKLLGIEHQIQIRIGHYEPVHAIADEDLERSTEEKTSAVHFLRFEFSPEMIAAAQAGAAWSIECGHPAYSFRVDPLPESTARALRRDFTVAESNAAPVPIEHSLNT